MKKLILIQWDMQTGPIPIIQFPPDKASLSKETLLKIWAQHETSASSNFIAVKEGMFTYSSLLKKIQNQTYFIILEQDASEKKGVYQEIMENIADDLLSNLESPHFTHILSDTYKTIKNYSLLNDQQLFLMLFDDKIRVAIFEILQQGTITKVQLKQILETEYGYTNLNLDLFLTPFLRLGLIEILTLHGTDESIFLIKDVYCSRIPPKFLPNNPVITELIHNFYSKPQIIPLNETQAIAHLLQKPGIMNLITLIDQNNKKGVSYRNALFILENNTAILNELIDELIVSVENNAKVYLISKIFFKKFTPEYLAPTLLNRYKNQEISLEQLEYQLSKL